MSTENIKLVLEQGTYVMYINKNLLKSHSGYFDNLLNDFKDETEITLLENWDNYKIIHILFGQIEYCKKNNMSEPLRLNDKVLNEKLRKYHDYYDCKINIQKLLYISDYYKQKEYTKLLVDFNSKGYFVIEPKQTNIKYKITDIKILFDINSFDSERLCHIIYTFDSNDDKIVGRSYMNINIRGIHNFNEFKLSSNNINFAYDYKISPNSESNMMMKNDQLFEIDHIIRNSRGEQLKCAFRHIKQNDDRYIEFFKLLPKKIKLLIEIEYCE